MSLSKASVKLLSESYLGQQVVVFLKDLNITTFDEEAGEARISMAIDGIVVEIDADFLHLGLPDGSITRSIPHTSVGLIEIMFTAETLDMDLPVDGDIH